MIPTPAFSGGIINTFFALLFAVNLVAILWSLGVYFTEFGSEQGKASAKSLVLSSVTILFFLMCVFAIIEWVRATVGF